MARTGYCGKTSTIGAHHNEVSWAQVLRSAHLPTRTVGGHTIANVRSGLSGTAAYAGRCYFSGGARGGLATGTSFSAPFNSLDRSG